MNQCLILLSFRNIAHHIKYSRSSPYDYKINDILLRKYTVLQITDLCSSTILDNDQFSCKKPSLSRKAKVRLVKPFFNLRALLLENTGCPINSCTTRALIQIKPFQSPQKYKTRACKGPSKSEDRANIITLLPYILL